MAHESALLNSPVVHAAIILQVMDNRIVDIVLSQDSDVTIASFLDMRSRVDDDSCIAIHTSMRDTSNIMQDGRHFYLCYKVLESTQAGENYGVMLFEPGRMVSKIEEKLKSYYIDDPHVYQILWNAMIQIKRVAFSSIREFEEWYTRTSLEDVNAILLENNLGYSLRYIKAKMK